MFETMIDFLKVSSVVFSAIGAYFWIRRNVWNSPAWIAELSVSHYDYNLPTIKELAGQQADSLVAWIYIFLAMLAQAILFFTPQTWTTFVPFGVRHIFYFLILGALLLWIGNFISRNQEERIFLKVKSILKIK